MAGNQFRSVAASAIEGRRITADEALLLYEKAPLSLLALLASNMRERLNGKRVLYNINFHLEPTNICIYGCRFCSYHRERGDEGSWDYSTEQMLEMVRNHASRPVTEIHITGGVHEGCDLRRWGDLIEKIGLEIPSIHIKAFSAVEIDYMAESYSRPPGYVLQYLKERGLSSLPGGGAEIFDSQIRELIAPKKPSAERWLEIHRIAHALSLPSNATMLYGHVEKYRHRVDHMLRIRDLQDETGGFLSFIPLKYRSANNLMKDTGEVPLTEDLRNYAVARLFLDNIRHLKAYWPMLGKESAASALSFGVDDIDGTIEESTSIYRMAGNRERAAMSVEELRELITSARYEPAERDSLYNIVNREPLSPGSSSHPT